MDRFEANAPGEPGADLYSVVLHEIGHAVGFDTEAIDLRDGLRDDDIPATSPMTPTPRGPTTTSPRRRSTRTAAPS